ncbi:MAG: LPS export ABC transporter periplasmic protein LptC [Rickettsiales bacterium]|nr:LPS export ABC transporter periplasmic protein LptC [Rickettsiales bacterium]
MSDFKYNVKIRTANKRRHRTKKILACVAALLALPIIIIPIMKSQNMGIRGDENTNYSDASPYSDSNSQKIAAPEKSTMVNPHFKGMDKNSNPYNITADKAVQLSTDKVLLETIQGDLITEEESWYSLAADLGHLTLSQKTLNLEGDIILFSYQGYELRTETATVDIEKGEIQTKDYVEIKGPMGTINSVGLTFNNNEQTAHFNGPVKVVINNPNEQTL